MSTTNIKSSASQLTPDDRTKLIDLLLQRVIARLEIGRDQQALLDMREVLELMGEDDRKNHFITQYLLGTCEYGAGLYQDAAHTFLRAIENRLQLAQTCTEEDLLQMEKEFLNMQLEAKKPLEKAVVQLGHGLNLWNKTVSNATAGVANWFNHDLGVNPGKDLIQPKPRTAISVELLHIRAGLAYYDGAMYDEAIEQLTRAIQIGSAYHSELMEQTYYNRGLCYYYSKRCREALDDFSRCIALMPLTKQREQPYLMRAATYGRLGMQKERDDDVLKSKFINVFSRPVTLFHYRLLDEDTLQQILSFLETRHLVILSSCNKHWKSLSIRYMENHFVDLRVASLIDRVHDKCVDDRNAIEKVFLPERSVTADKVQKGALLNSLLVQHAKNVVIWDSSMYTNPNGSYYYYGGDPLCMDVVRNYKGLKRVVIGATAIEFFKELHENSPGVEYMDIRDKCFAVDQLEYCVLNFVQLERLILPAMALFSMGDVSMDPFAGHHPALKVVEYREPTEEQVTAVTSDLLNAPRTMVLWDDIVHAHPEIRFIKLTTEVQSLYEYL